MRFGSGCLHAVVAGTSQAPCILHTLHDRHLHERLSVVAGSRELLLPGPVSPRSRMHAEDAYSSSRILHTVQV